MGFNHRFLLRLITNLLICTLVLSSVSVLLWTIDEFIGWDILPENISVYVRGLIIGIAWVTFTFIVAHTLLSITLFAEASASRAKLPDLQISLPLKRRLKRILALTVMVSILLIVGLQAVDGVRKNITERTARQEAIIEFNQIQKTVDQSLPKVLKLFTPSLLKSIQTNTISASEINQIFESVRVSFPHEPSLALLIPAKQPYKYYKLDRQAIALGKNSVPYLRPQFYLGFPNQVENQVVAKLFSKQVYALKNELKGGFINNTNPSYWGVLKLNNQAIALVYLGVNYTCPQPTKLIKDTCISPGPKTLHTN